MRSSRNPMIRAALSFILTFLSHPLFAEDNAFELSPQISMVTASTFSLNRSTSQIDLKSPTLGMPLFFLGTSFPLGQVQDFRFSFLTRVGFGYRSWENTSRPTSSLFWLPMQGLAKVSYQIPGISFVSPGLSFGAGVHFLSYSQTLQSPSVKSWIPHLIISPTLSFLDARVPGEWFGGFRFSVTHLMSLGENNRLRAWSIDLGAQIFL